MVEQTITIGNIIEICVILGGVIAGLAVMRTTVKNMQKELSDLKKDLNTDLQELKIEIKTINTIITDNAVINTRLNSLERHYEELRHGVGYVQGRKGVDGEYP